MSAAPRDVSRLHALFADACFGDSEAALGGDLSKYLARQGVAKEDADALLASPRRLGLYRQLLRHNVTNVIGQMLERTRDRLNRRAPGVFAKTVSDWLAAEGPKTPHLRDVPSEFLAWAAPRWRRESSSDPRIPSWLVDHAELELVEFTISVAPRPLPPPPLADVAPDRPLVFADPRVIVRLTHAVHELPADDFDAVPAEREVRILAYRDGEHRTRFLDLTPAAAAILAKLFEGLPLANAMVEGCKAADIPLDNTVLAGAARLLADLGERGVLLGARSS